MIFIMFAAQISLYARCVKNKQNISAIIGTICLSNDLNENL